VFNLRLAFLPELSGDDGGATARAGELLGSQAQLPPTLTPTLPAQEPPAPPLLASRRAKWPQRSGLSFVGHIELGKFGHVHNVGSALVTRHSLKLRIAQVFDKVNKDEFVEQVKNLVKANVLPAVILNVMQQTYKRELGDVLVPMELVTTTVSGARKAQ
jgi:hypothetical protein